MTATYDGKLVLAKDVNPKVRARHIEPCCAEMHRAVFSKVIYQTTGNRIMVRTGEKSGIELRYCPFCGAIPEVEE